MYEDAIPERTLITRIIEQAIIDAENGSRDAHDFLTTNRVNPFLYLLGIDVKAFKERIEQVIDQGLYS